MEKTKFNIDFDTMRVNCIQIHQEVFELFIVSEYIGEELNLIVNSADELRTHPETKTWEGMGRFAKSLHDNDKLWNQLPDKLFINLYPEESGSKTEWIKNNVRKELLDCYYHLGGKNLYNI